MTFLLEIKPIIGQLKKLFGPFLLRVVGAFLTYFSAILVVDFYGPEEGGDYFTLMAVWMLVYGVGKFGLDTLSLRFVSAADLGSKKTTANYFFKIALIKLFKYSLFLLVVSVIVYALFSPFNEKAQSIWLAALYVSPITVMIFIMSSCLQGSGYISLSTLSNGVLISLFFVLFLYLFAPSAGYEKIFIFANLAALIVVVALYNLVGRAQEIQREDSKLDKKAVNKASLILTVSTLLTLLNVWLGQIVVSAWFSDLDKTLFGAGDRTSKLFMIFLIAVNAVVAPKMARLWEQGDNEKLAKMLKGVVTALTVLGVIFFCLIFSLSEVVVGAFGLSGDIAVMVLLILSAGQLINLMTGPSVLMLTMTGHEKILILIQSGGLITFLIMLMFGMQAGVLGIAVAQALSISLFNILCLYFGFRALTRRSESV